MMRVMCGIAIVTLACASLFGCARFAPPKKAEAPKLEVQVTGTALETASPEYIQKFQPDVRLTARWQDGQVWVAISNESDKTLQVSPADFAVLAEGKKVIPVSPETAVAQFPVTTLAPKAAASGTFRFRGMGDLTGRPLVFSNPLVRPSRCIIKKENAPAALADPPKSGDKASPASSPARDKDERKPLVVTVKKKGKSGQIIVGSKKVTPEELSALVKAEKARRPDLGVKVEADKSVPYGAMFEALDAIKRGGVDNVDIPSETAADKAEEAKEQKAKQ